MKVTERFLLDAYQGLTKGGCCLSVSEGRRYYWNYRRYDDGYRPMVTDREKADFILEEGWWNRAIELNPNCMDHPALAQMELDWHELLHSPVSA